MIEKNISNWFCKGGAFNLFNGQYREAYRWATEDEKWFYGYTPDFNPGNLWYTGVTITSSNPAENSEEEITFHLSEGMSFSDLNGYNGCISFAFFNDSDFSENNNTCYVDNLHFINYRSELQLNMGQESYRVGGIGTRMFADPHAYGFSLALFPSTNDGYDIPANSSDSGTRQVRYYKLVTLPRKAGDRPGPRQKTEESVTLQGYLPNPVDLSDSTVIRVTKNTSDNSNSIYINNYLIETIYSWNNSIYNMTEMKTAINAIGSANSKPAICLESYYG